MGTSSRAGSSLLRGANRSPPESTRKNVGGIEGVASDPRVSEMRHQGPQSQRRGGQLQGARAPHHTAPAALAQQAVEVLGVGMAGRLRQRRHHGRPVAAGLGEIRREVALLGGPARLL